MYQERRKNVKSFKSQQGWKTKTETKKHGKKTNKYGTT